MLTATEALDLAWATRDPSFLAAHAAARLLPILRARDEIRAWIATTVRGQSATRRYSAPPFWRNARVNLGAFAMPALPFPGDTAELFQKYLSSLVVVEPDPVNVSYLHKFINLAERHGAKVFLLLPPVATEVGEACDRAGFTARQSAYVRAFQDRHPGLTVIDARASGYGRMYFFADPIHLNNQGALALTSDLAPVLARTLAGGPLDPWITLPRPRLRPHDVIEVENVNESGLALKNNPLIRR
jgi:hypothetical protein